MKDRKKLLSNKTSSPRNVVGDLRLTQPLYKQEISSFNTAKSAGDSRQKLSGMTPLFNSNAFTLIELLVVVLIIGILSAIALPQYQKAVIQTKLTRIETLMNSLFMSLDTYILANGIPTEAHYINMSELDVGINFHSYNSGEYSYYNEYGQWIITISPYNASVYFYGRDSMKKIIIGINRNFSTHQLRLNNVPEDTFYRKIICQWWANKYGANTIINGANPDYPAKTWCAEVGIQ